jgi:hypothetical protein
MRRDIFLHTVLIKRMIGGEERVIEKGRIPIGTGVETIPLFVITVDSQDILLVIVCLKGWFE